MEAWTDNYPSEHAPVTPRISYLPPDKIHALDKEFQSQLRAGGSRRDVQRCEELTAFQLFKLFLTERLSAHAFPRIFNSPTTFRQVAWALVSVVFLGLLIWQVCDTIHNYFQYPKTTTIEVVDAKWVYFPAVTVCSLSPLLKSKACDTQWKAAVTVVDPPACDPDWNQDNENAPAPPTTTPTTPATVTAGIGPTTSSEPTPESDPATAPGTPPEAPDAGSDLFRRRKRSVSSETAYSAETTELVSSDEFTAATSGASGFTTTAEFSDISTTYAGSTTDEVTTASHTTARATDTSGSEPTADASSFTDAPASTGADFTNAEGTTAYSYDDAATEDATVAAAEAGYATELSVEEGGTSIEPAEMSSVSDFAGGTTISGTLTQNTSASADNAETSTSVVSSEEPLTSDASSAASVSPSGADNLGTVYTTGQLYVSPPPPPADFTSAPLPVPPKQLLDILHGMDSPQAVPPELLKKILDSITNTNDQFHNVNIADFASVMRAMRTVDGSEIPMVFTPSQQEILEAGVNGSEFIISCSYDGRQCSHMDFLQWQSGVYGNCFTFNSVFEHLLTEDQGPPDGPPPAGEPGDQPSASSGPLDNMRITTHSGARFGLRLMLNVSEEEFIPSVSPSVGVRVSVHHPLVPPFPEDNGLNVELSTSTAISVAHQFVKRVKKPYGNCVDNADWNKKHKGAYTSEACLNECVEQRVRSRCRCISDLHTILRPPTDDDRDLPRCNPTNKTQDSCTTDVETKFLSEEEPCVCPPACREHTYPTTSSFDQVGHGFPGVIRQLKQKNLPDEPLNIHIYMESLSTTVVTENPAFTALSLISSIGGTIGLFVGLSLVTVIEVLEFVYDFAVMFCHCRRRSKVTDLSSNEADDVKPPSP